jgi:hypothetical protein
MSYSNYEQSVIIDGYKLLGVQSVDGSYGISEKPIRVAGVGFVDALVDAPLEGNFSINRKMVGTDPLLETNSIGKYRFNEEEFEGSILYDNDTKGFGFTKGRVSRYSVSCTAGEIPDIQVDFTVYGNLGSGIINNATKTHPDIRYPDQASIKIEVSDFEIDAISDFSFSQSITTTPIYALPRGEVADWYEENPSLIAVNVDPIQIDTQYPIETDINFTIIADEYEIREIKDRLQAAPKSDVVINIFDAQDSLYKINSFTGFDMRLTSESLNSSIDGEVSISLTYKGYETYHNPISNNIGDTEYNLTVVGDGGTNLGGGQYVQGENIKIRAIADPGYKFSNWELIEGGGTIEYINSGTTNFLTSFKDTTISGVYDQTYLVTLEGANGSEAGAGYYEENELVVVSASPAAGYNFSDWDVLEGGVNFLTPSSPSQSFTMPNNTVRLRANYSPISYNISISGDNGTQTVSTNSASIGDQVTVTAQSDPGYLFAYWSVAERSTTVYNSNFDRTNITGSFTMPADDVSIVANYMEA